MNAFNIRSWADFRAFLYVLLPVFATLSVTYGVFTDTESQLWVSLATAILGPVIAAINARSVSLFRTAFYTVLAAVQALVVNYGFATDATFAHWTPLIVAIVGLTGGGLAAANTDTSPAAADR